MRNTATEITHWANSQAPTESFITRLMKKEGLTPYEWRGTPNSRQPVRSHNYHRILYVVEGTLTLSFPDANQMIKLKIGDRAQIPAGVRHAIEADSRGFKCLEAAVRR
jgi:quercetin dioxygenase-like cupin family protein